MSLRLMNWVAEECDIDDYVEFRIMMLLAKRADDDGTGAWPSLDNLAEQIRRSRRTAQRGLERLRDAGRIRLGDQSRIPDRIQANHRPKVWDIVIPGVTQDVIPDDPVDVTPDVTPECAVGVTPDVVLGVTSDGTQKVLHSLRNEKVLVPARETEIDDDAPTEPPASPKPKKATRKKKRETSLPDTWHPSDTHTKLARELGLSDAQARLQLDLFRDHARLNDRKTRDWDAAFRNWLRKAIEYGLRPANGREPSAAPKVDPRTGNLVESRW